MSQHPEKHVILGIHVTGRTEHVPEVQKLLSQFGCNIKTRIGFHDVSEDFCSPNGLILLEMFGEEAKGEELAGALNALQGIEVKKMVFDH